MIDYIKKFSLEDKTAFVVGGLGLIGKEVSKAFSMAGSKTIILDKNNEEGELFNDKMNNKGYDTEFNIFDCSDMKNMELNFSSLIDKYDCPDIFINCSYPFTKDWSDTSFKNINLDSFQKNIDIHMNSYSWLARLAAESMVEVKKEGSIIQIGSIYGVVGQDLNIYEGTLMNESMAYATIKGGITNLSRQMASYYGQFGIRVNTLCPGGLDGHVSGSADSQDPTFIDNYSNKVPLKRLGKSEEVASTALFLASEASSYISGATIMVDGGWTSI